MVHLLVPIILAAASQKQPTPWDFGSVQCQEQDNKHFQTAKVLRTKILFLIDSQAGTT